MELSKYTRDLLEDIERRIDPEVEDDYLRQWESFWSGNDQDIIFNPKRKKTFAPNIEVKAFNINDALTDYEIMLNSELERVSRVLNSGKGALAIRANYGTGIIPSLFGANIFVMPREQNTLPTATPLGGTDAIRRIAEGGVPSLEGGFGKNVFEFGQMCLDVLKDYPKLSKYLYVYHPDTQGPLDVAELLWGSEIFYAFYDSPELIHQLMGVVTDTYKAFLDKWFKLYPNREGLNVHWDFFIKGNICIRNDSAMNLSPDLYEEFAFRYDKHLLDYFGGGILHFCGRGDHYIDITTTADNLYGVNLSQPHLNDMDKIYSSVVGRGKKILALTKEACEEYERREDAVRSMIYCGRKSSVQNHQVKI
ncbi:MAG: hypothetical protein IJF38_03325 [Clostridia bacterium]|nr:hypothetical protein [Clostridia bacterium]